MAGNVVAGASDKVGGNGIVVVVLIGNAGVGEQDLAKV